MPSLQVPQFQHVTIFRAVEQALRDDPTFSGACNTFLAWTGSALDTAVPEQSLCPFCKISPPTSPAQMATERQHSAPLNIDVEVAVKGTHFDDLGNFWGLIWAVFFDMGDMDRFNAMTAALQDAGVTRPVMTMQAFGHYTDENDNTLLIGRGTIQFNSLLPK
jgi:hypothetical protein